MGRPNATMSAMLVCPFGLAPSNLVPLPTPRVMVEGKPAATISDSLPGANIPPFGMCNSLANPAVAAATAAALGVLTPMPCVPTPVGTWVGGAATTMVGGKPALTLGATCQCAFGGTIQITNPGATRTMSS
ncbi:DUF4280 domain-containing protein [Rarobacter faecitabidus]|uniref:Uncharacterized protein DUF4280 n=1 Tax=Rarobacter faecitabidus TaxID=13243 RepID=A0A542ZED8_RARFA|nr:DUF4280 domain-containing protein [Rarobacter faecitabidus]TQL58649.1 uncharacterized protein DUF4280 [Rarobacter faecitabidus]